MDWNRPEIHIKYIDLLGGNQSVWCKDMIKKS